MSIEEFRKKMWAYRQSADKEADALKEPNLAWVWLMDQYRQCNEEERRLADQVLSEWVLSSDESVRDDALVLIEEFQIASARPALHELADRLKRSNAPGAPHELKWVGRILGEVASDR